MTLADYSKTGWAPEKAAHVLNKSILGLGKVEVVVCGARVGSFVQAGYGHRRIVGKCLIHKNTLVVVHLLVKARYSYLFHSVSVKLKRWFTTSFLQLGGRCRKAMLGVCVSVCVSHRNLLSMIKSRCSELVHLSLHMVIDEAIKVTAGVSAL